MIKAVTFDAYGTLIRNEDLTLIHRRIAADHALTVPLEDIWRAWIDLYHEATQASPFRTLREIEHDILSRVLHVGDSEIDDVKGARDAGLQVAWVNRNGRARRSDVPRPDFEFRDLTELLALL